MMSEGEIWKDIVGYEGYYKVSNKGNVRSVVRKDSIGRKCGGRKRKHFCREGGYPDVSLYKDGLRKQKLVHRLVAEAFIPNPNGLPEVNHLDENKKNNCVENLEWCTSKYNTNHGTLIERLSKKVRAVNIKTGEVITFNSTQEAGCKGYSQSGVTSACRGVYKSGSTGKLIGDGRTYKGHRWSYI